MTTPVLTYSNNRGLSAAVRMTLCAAGLEFKEVNLETREQFLELRDTQKKLLFRQVPLLEIDGKNLVQSRAIVNYLARKYNLYGKNNEEATMIDMLVEGARDFYAPFLSIVFVGTEEDTVAKFRENQFPKYMPIFEKVLADSGKQYLVGDSLSIADLALLEVLLAVDEFMGAKSFDEYPKLKGHYNFLKALPRIKTYLENHRKLKNTPAIVSKIKAILAI